MLQHRALARMRLLGSLSVHCILKECCWSSICMSMHMYSRMRMHNHSHVDQIRWKKNTTVLETYS